jgi:hypothetical protein
VVWSLIDAVFVIIYWLTPLVGHDLTCDEFIAYNTPTIFLLFSTTISLYKERCDIVSHPYSSIHLCSDEWDNIFVVYNVVETVLNMSIWIVLSISI